jgi:pimeloyl-ACP methyl ester carboxylesterase
MVTAFWGAVCMITQIIWTLCGSDDFLHVPPKLSSELCDSLELKVIAEYVSHSESVKSDWVSLDVELKPGLNGTFQVHSLIISSSSPSTTTAGADLSNEGDYKDIELCEEGKPALLWIHGIGSSAALSFGITGVIDRLLDTYDIYALDLPGFGRSTAPVELKRMKGALLYSVLEKCGCMIQSNV